MRKIQGPDVLNIPRIRQEAGNATAMAIDVMQQRLFSGIGPDGSLQRDVKSDWAVERLDGERVEFGCIASIVDSSYNSIVTQDVTDWELVSKSGAFDATPSLIGLTHDRAFAISIRRLSNDTLAELYTITDGVMQTPAAISGQWSEVAASASFSGRMVVNETNTHAAFFHIGGGANRLVIVDLSDGTKTADIATTLNQASNAAQPVWVDNYIYWPDYVNANIVVFDVSTLASPVESATFTTSLADVRCLVVNGDALYGIGTGGVVGIDRSSPTALFEDDTETATGTYVSMDLDSGVLFMAVRANSTQVRVATMDVSGTTVTLNTEALVSLSTSVMGGESVIFHNGYAIVFSHFNPASLNVLDGHVFNVTDPTSVTVDELLSYTHAASGNLGPVITRAGHYAFASFNFQTESQVARPLENSVVNQVCTVKLANGGTGADFSTTGPGVLQQETNGAPITVGPLDDYERTPLSVITVTSDTTLTNDNRIVLVDASSGNVTITVPDAAGSRGIPFTVTKIDSSGNLVTTSGATINGSSSLIMSSQYDSAMMVSDATQYWISG